MDKLETLLFARSRAARIRVDVGAASAVNLETMIYFGAAGGSFALALSLLFARYVRKDPQAVRSGGGYTLFAAFLVLFAVGAVVAGIASARAG